MYEKVKIGMFGLGTVGSGVVGYLRDFYDPGKTGLEIEINKICVKHPEKQRSIQLPPGILTANPDDILENPEIDVVVEVMGGIEPAGAYILRALGNQKHVVTANKAFLTYQPRGLEQRTEVGKFSESLKKGTWTKDLGGYMAFLTALSEKRNIGFEASVCGEIPIIDFVSTSPSKKDIDALEGILNGTSNYILTYMSQGANYEEALSQAQQNGFAEADPSFDVDGIDATQKLAILSTLIFCHRVEVPQIVCESISPVTQQDIKYANFFGYAIKPLALARRHEEDLLELRVCPTLLPHKDMLASVNLETNAVSLYLKDRSEPQTFIGKGAGMTPTARSVIRDIVTVVKNPFESRAEIYNLFICSPKDFSQKAQEFESASYLRINVSDQPGVLGTICTLLGGYEINIEAFLQKQEDKRDNIIPTVMLLGFTTEEKISKAVEAIRGFGFVKEALRIRRKTKA